MKMPPATLLVLVATILLAGCGFGDTGYTCDPGETIPIESGTYSLDDITGTLVQGPATEGTAVVDREAGRVTLTYTNTETGAEVVETYDIKALGEVNPATSENPSGFPAIRR